MTKIDVAVETFTNNAQAQARIYNLLNDGWKIEAASTSAGSQFSRDLTVIFSRTRERCDDR